LLPFSFDLIPVHLEPPPDEMAGSYLLLHSHQEYHRQFSDKPSAVHPVWTHAPV